MIHRQFDNTSEMIDSMTSSIFIGSIQPEFIKADRLYFYNLVLEVERPSNDLNFREVLWLKKRWQKFGKDYLSEMPILDWVDYCLQNKDGISKNAEVGYQFSKRNSSAGHRLLGNCLWGLSFHQQPRPQITITSRVTNFLPVGYLEMSLANLLCQAFSQRLGEPCSYVWYISQLQFSLQWSFAYWKHIWMPAHKNDLARAQTPHVKLWTTRLTKRFNEFQRTRIPYPYKRETNLYLKMLKEVPTYFPRLEDL